MSENATIPLDEAPIPAYSFERSKTAQHLQVEPLMDDFDIETKARTIDAHVDTLVDEEYRGTDLGYKLGIEKAMQEIGINYMEEMKKGKSMEIMDRLFSRIALRDKLSSGTFLSKAREQVKQAKILRLNDQIKNLKALVVAN